MSVGQVFAPIFITNNDRATEEVNRLIRLRLSMGSGPQIRLLSTLNIYKATTIAEVLAAGPTCEHKPLMMLNSGPLDGEHVFLRRACTRIAESMPEERNKALVTLIRETIGSSTYTLKAFHDLLFLANYYPSVEEATSDFSSAPKSFRQGRDFCSGEIETEKFARSIGLVFVPNNRVLPVEEVTRVIEQENAMLNNANTLDELFQTLQAHRPLDISDRAILNIPSTFSRFQTIVMHKTTS